MKRHVMNLLSSSSTLSFLSAAAPRPWVKRMLTWMILNDELHAYFTRGMIRPHAPAVQFLMGLAERAGEVRGPNMDALIRAEYELEIADQLVGRDIHDRVYDDPIQWAEADEPQRVSGGFFLFAAELDWELGTLKTDYIPDEREAPEWLFWDREEHLGSQFDRAEFEVELSGLCFDRGVIEMLLPTGQLNDDRNGAVASRALVHKGRPRKWDWDGAMAHLVSLAQHPDGLPQGYGAQAYIEKAMSEWFVESTGDSPSTGQIRERAQPIMRALQSAEKGFQAKQAN